MDRAHEPFEWRGKYFDYDRVSIWPRPLQQPHPPIILPADSDEGLEIAASRRVPTGSAYRSSRPGRAPSSSGTASSPPGTAGRPGPSTVTCVRHVYVAETNAAGPRGGRAAHRLFLAEASQLPPRLHGAHGPVGAAAAGADREGRGRAASTSSTSTLCQREGLTIIGDPDYVVREIQAQARELGVGVLVGLFQFGSLPHALAQKNIRLFGEKVLPALKRA